MVNIAVVGAGYWGPNLIRNFYQLKEASLRTVCDTIGERLSYIAERYPNVKLTKNYDEVLNDKEIDAVVIATPAESHYALTEKSLLANKHSLVEKPLAISSGECESLIRLAEEKKRILMVGHTFIYNPAVNKLREYITNGELGEIYYIYSQRLNFGRVRHDVNAMWNFAPHDVSIILYLLNAEPIGVSAKGLTYLQDGVPDVVFMNLDFTGGTGVHIHVSWLDPNKVRKMTVVGSKKMVVYDDVSSDAKIQVYDKGITRKDISVSLGDFDSFGKFQLIHRAGDLLIPKIDFKEPLQVECKHFIECIRAHKTPKTDGRSGLMVVKILEAAQRSLDNNGISIPLT